MARKQVIKPDFTINNINAVNNDPGARNFVGGTVYKPARYVQKFDKPFSRGSSTHDDNLSVARKTNLTALNFDGDDDYVEFSNHSDFSFIRTIEQDTINFTNNNANSKITVADDSTLSMNKETSTTVSNFVYGSDNNNFRTYYTAPDTADLSFVKTEGETQVLNFAGNSNSRIQVNDADSLSFVKEVNTTVATFTRSTGAGAFGSVADNDALSIVGADAEVSAVQFSANTNSEVNMSAYSADFEFGNGSSDVGFTFAFWINPTSIPSTFTRIFGFYGGQYYLQYDSGELNMILRDASLNAFNQFKSPQVSSNHILAGEAGNWVHIAMVYTPETSANANDEQIQFYKNGSAWGSAVTSPNGSYVAMETNTSARFTLGNYIYNSNTGNNRFAGMLSNFLVFKHDGQNNHASVARSTTPLTAAQVLGLYNGGRVMANYNNHPKSDDLVGYWKLDEDISDPNTTEIEDYSGEDNHLDTIGSAVTEDSTSGLLKRQDDSFTITVWIKKSSTSGIGQIYQKGTSSGNTREHGLNVNNRQLQLIINDNSPTDGDGTFGRVQYQTNTTFLSNTADEWEHITVVYDTISQNVIFHRNGGSAQTGTANDTQTITESAADAQASGADDYDSSINLGQALTIGCFAYTAAGRTDDFDGRMAHLAIFKYGTIANPMVATPSHVRGLYNGGFMYDYSLHHIHKGYLKGYWKLNNTTATKNSPTLDITALGSGGFTTAVDSDLKEKQDTDFTVSFWVKRKGAGVYAIIGKEDEYNLYVDDRLIKIDLEDQTGGNGNVATTRWQTASDFLDNNTTNWQHVTVAYDASAKTVKFYKNGELVTTDSTPSSYTYNEMENTTNNFYIGRTGSNNNHLLAELAHLAIFSHDGQSGRSSTAMSDAEVYKLYDRDGTSGNASSVAGKVYHLKSTHAKAADLVGYWHLDEDPSSTATIEDYSGLSNDGATTGTGTTTLTNPANSGLDSADFVDVSFSISFWMKKASTSSDSENIIRKGTSSGTDLEYWIFRNDRALYMYLYDNTPTDGVGSTGATFYNTNGTFLSNNNTDWEHITIAYDASTQNVTFYNNGENAQTETGASADFDNDYDSMFDGTGLFHIGQGSTSDSSGFDGQLAHLAVFKHDGQSGRSSAVPTAAQVKGGYNGGNVYDLNAGTQHPKKADIVGYWKLDGTTATVGDDLTAGLGASTSTATDLKTTTDVDMTFAFWFKKSAATGGVRRAIIAKTNEYYIFIFGQHLHLRMFDAYPSDGGAASFKSHYITSFVTDDTSWQHIVIKYDASTETATAFKNGGAATTLTLTQAADFDDSHDTTSQLTIGYNDSSTSEGFGGQIAQLAIFKHDGLDSRSSTILTDNEAKGLYNGGNVYDYTRHPKAGDLVGYWKLNQTVGNNVVVTDSSGEGNNGAMTGATSLTNPANSGLNEVKDNSFTVGFWMNKDSKTDNGNVIYKTSEYYIRVASRNLQLVIYDSTDMDGNVSGHVQAETSTNPLADSTGTWEHVIVSYDAANRQVLFFVDKVLKQTVSVSSDADYNEMQDGSNVLRIGHTNNSFDGKLSNVIMFDHGAAGLPFDATDAEELYSDGYVYDYNNHSRASDIVAWWKLEGNGNDSHTGGSHNGTVNEATSAANSGLYEFEDQDFAIGFFVRPLDSTTLTISDGDAASGMTEREKVTITDTLGTAIKYIICDSNGAGAPSTGTALEVGDDTGAGTATEAGTAVTIDLTGTPDTQNAFLVQLKAAIESAAGHNGTITVSAVPTEAGGRQTIKLTGAHKTDIPTDDISQLAIGHPNTRYCFNKYFEYYMYYNDNALVVSMVDITPKQVSGGIQGLTQRNFSFSYSLPMNQFTHVVVSYDKSEEKMHLYIDGVEQGSGVTSTDPDYQESGGEQSGFYLGNYTASNTSDANLSHFVIFKNRHLTESEADELYNNGIGYNYLNHSRASDISAFYKLDESLDNSTLVDSSGNNNDLTTTSVDIEEVEESPAITGAKKLPQLPMRMHIPGVASLRTNPQK